MMRWLLWQRTEAGEWVPAYGALSTFAHGALIWGFVSFFSVFVVLLSVSEIRRGRPGFRKMLAWGLVIWPLDVLAALPHLHPPGSRAFMAWACVALASGLLWVAWGIAQVGPLLLRHREDQGTLRGEKP